LSFSVYVSGLLVELSRHSIGAIAAKSPVCSYARLQYFLSDAKWDHEQLNALRLKALHAHKVTSSSNSGIVAIDDTGARKSRHTKNTDGAKYQYFPCDNRQDYCNIFVTSAYCDPDKHFPINLTPYIPEDAVFHTGKSFVFKSKQELAREHIDYAIEQKISFSDFVFDHWYFSKETVRHIESRERTFISELGAKMRVMYRHKWVRVDELAILIPATDFRRETLPNRHGQDRKFFIHSFITKLKFLGMKKKYLITIAKGGWTDDDPNKRHVYVTNRLNLDGREILRRWGLRWGIERIHQELKECCALDQFQVREARDIARHCHLAMLAHSYLYWGLRRGHFARETADKPKNIYEALEIHRGLHCERSLAWSTANPDVLKRFLRLSRISKSNFDAGRQRKVA
jgi:SRSO17 transposase